MYIVKASSSKQPENSPECGGLECSLENSKAKTPGALFPFAQKGRRFPNRLYPRKDSDFSKSKNGGPTTLEGIAHCAWMVTHWLQPFWHVRPFGRSQFAGPFTSRSSLIRENGRVWKRQFGPLASSEHWIYTFGKCILVANKLFVLFSGSKSEHVQYIPLDPPYQCTDKILHQLVQYS